MIEGYSVTPQLIERVQAGDLSALHAASIEMNIASFTASIAERVRWSLEHAPGEAAKWT